jgi:DNA-binding PadR family transcriptional regulator
MGGTFKGIVLGLLRAGAAQHGYALMKAYEARSGIRTSTGTFYRELQRLLAEGLIRAVERPPDVDARRAPYQITPAGAAVFDAWLLEPTTRRSRTDDELSTRALFLLDVRQEVLRKVLDTWQSQLLFEGKVLERERERACSARSRGQSASPMLALLLSRRLKHTSADLEFLDDVSAAHPSLLPRGVRPRAAADATAPRGRRGGRAGKSSRASRRP